MEPKKHYYSIDLAKFSCAILVIALHTNVVDQFSQQFSFIIRNFIYNLLVPFFFICSGYFFYRGQYEKKDYYKKYIYKIFKIYFFWTSIYMPIIFLNYINNERGAIINLFIFIRNFLFAGSVYHLWYLISLIYSIYIISLLIKKNRFKELLILPLLCLIFILWGQSSYGENSIITKIYMLLFGGVNSGLAVGLLFTSIGVLINKYNLSNSKYLVFSFLIGAIYLLLIFLAYYSIYYSFHIIYIFSIVVLGAIFNIILNWRRVPTINKIGNINLTVYCLHPLVLIIIVNLESYVNIPMSNIINFVLVFILTFIIAVCVEKIKVRKQKEFNYKRRLYFMGERVK